MLKWLLSCLDAKPVGGSKIMEQEQIRKSYDSDNRERFGSTDPLGGFIAEVESGAGVQAPDAAAVRYERMCNEAQLGTSLSISSCASLHILS